VAQLIGINASDKDLPVKQDYDSFLRTGDDFMKVFSTFYQ
jgi:hypothetical protein